MYRQQPVSSKIINKKFQERDTLLHQQKLKQISSQVDSKKPDFFNPLIYTQNKKKVQLMENKYTEIERENRILLEKITKIMHPPKTTKNQQTQESAVLNSFSRNNNYSTIQQPQSAKKRSLNQLNRRKELLGIMEENRRILDRIKTRKSEYDHRKWEDDHKRNEQLVNKISEYPVTLYRKNDSKATFVRNDQYNPNNSHLDQIVADDIENPLTRVLEMFENDGLKVLNKFFNNNLEELVSNLKITDKIYIKGLEKYQTEPNDDLHQQSEKLQTDKSQMLTNNKSSPFIYDRGATDTQQDNGYTTNDSSQLNQPQLKSSTKENQNNQEQQRRKSVNKPQNSNSYLSSYYNSQTPNRKALREITEQNSTNNNTLESRGAHHLQERNSHNSMSQQYNNNNNGFTNSKLAMDFFNNQQQQQPEVNQSTTINKNSLFKQNSNDKLNKNQYTNLTNQYGADFQEDDEGDEEGEEMDNQFNLD